MNAVVSAPDLVKLGTTASFQSGDKRVTAMIHEGAALLRTGILASIAVLASVASAPAAEPSVPRYTADGQLLAPVGYESWVFVGSNFGLAYRRDLPARVEADASRSEQPQRRPEVRPDQQQFHNVYINPEAYAYFVATGEFPNPTILAMDRFAAADKEPKGIVSNGVFNGNRLGLEVAVKNLSRPDGKTTPWAYYDFTDPSDPAKPRTAAPAFPDAACESCHRQHASKDNVWVQFYPVLRGLTK
jgi:cytochrome P460